MFSCRRQGTNAVFLKQPGRTGVAKQHEPAKILSNNNTFRGLSPVMASLPLHRETSFDARVFWFAVALIITVT